MMRRTLKEQLGDLHEPDALQHDQLSAQDPQQGAVGVVQLSQDHGSCRKDGHDQQQVRLPVQLAPLQVECKQQPFHYKRRTQEALHKADELQYSPKHLN